MKFLRNIWFSILVLIPLFAVFSCGGGGGGSTAPPPPTVTTTPATNFTSSGATVNGTVNPNGLATQAWFEWGTSPTLATFDNTTKQNLAAGTSIQAVSASLTGLNFGTTYYYRVVASSTSGTVKGTIGNFSTSPVAPTVTTSAATLITTTSATLNGAVNPNGLDAEGWFEWGTDPTLKVATNTAHQVLGNGTTSLPITAALTPLSNGTTYYFRAMGLNSVGTQAGTILIFSTANPPPIANAGPDNTVLMGKTATLDGSGSSTTNPPIAYLWQQVAGTAVTLSSNTVAKPTFTAPAVTPIGEVLRFQLTVTDNTLLTASDNVDITVLWGFQDDFSDNTLGSYTTREIYQQPVPPPPPPTPEFNYDAAGQRVEVLTGDDVGLGFSHVLPASDNGVFSLDFYPRKTYPNGGGIYIKLMQDANNFYHIKGFQWDNVLNHSENAGVEKWVGGSIVGGSQDFINVNSYVSQDPNSNQYHVTITYTPASVTVQAFGETIVLNANNTPINVSMVEIAPVQQDCYIDNLELQAVP